MIRLAEVAAIILCTCFPMMPRLVKLISDGRAKSKSYSTSPLRHAWKRRIANGGKDDNTSGAGSAGSHAAEDTLRLKRQYEQSGEAENVTSDSSQKILWTEDLELASPTSDVRNFSDLLEQRLNTGFTIPKFSYLWRLERRIPMFSVDGERVTSGYTHPSRQSRWPRFSKSS